ncbi:hypothetical protein [Pseudomonas sp. R5(2019)]|uniref:hypothetical protein n=1 Tax=Pseudomonas sp. R5(2019) TaxID=2697566 RepID=UPI001412210F|nr:hypothetical protein [Pseudomonas sp. R5(2019)]NBA94853.1 hypothetical protein [Pseudomonas sp. R5(2019)]
MAQEIQGTLDNDPAFKKALAEAYNASIPASELTTKGVGSKARSSNLLLDPGVLDEMFPPEDEALAPSDQQVKSRGVLSWLGVAKYVARIVIAVVKRHANGRDHPEINTVEDDGSEKVKVLQIYATQKRGKAQERILPDSDGKAVGLLTHALLKSLREAPTDVAGRIPSVTLKGYVDLHWSDWFSAPVPPAPRIITPQAGDIFFQSLKPLSIQAFSLAAGTADGTQLNLQSSVLAATGTVRADTVVWIANNSAWKVDIPLEPPQADGRRVFKLKLSNDEHVLSFPGTLREAVKFVPGDANAIPAYFDPAAIEHLRTEVGKLGIQTLAGTPLLDLQASGTLEAAQGMFILDIALEEGVVVLTQACANGRKRCLPIYLLKERVTHLYLLSLRDLDSLKPIEINLDNAAVIFQHGAQVSVWTQNALKLEVARKAFSAGRTISGWAGKDTASIHATAASNPLLALIDAQLCLKSPPGSNNTRLAALIDASAEVLGSHFPDVIALRAAYRELTARDALLPPLDADPGSVERSSSASKELGAVGGCLWRKQDIEPGYSAALRR